MFRVLGIRLQRIHYVFILSISICVIWMMLAWHKQISSISEDYSEELLIRNRQDGLIAERRGLVAKGKSFTLDGKEIVIVSGAIHYFRFPQEYWRDRLMKMKACGLNAIETYVPWNLHEPQPGRYDFSGNLALNQFLMLADELDFLVFLRPGPYICSEWEFGGLPSWLLRDPTMRVRTMHPQYIKAVTRYFNKLLPIVKPFQYKNGGPIVAFQLDNEYGAYFRDTEYIPYLKQLMESHGINELFFVSDNTMGLKKQTVPGVLKTVNFKRVDNHFKDMHKIQPDAPLMVMEYWVGWFDWWGGEHHTMSEQEFGETLNEIFSAGASVNFYMFYGGTNFGFMNGGLRDGERYKSDITSYDYDALIAENGDLTTKYHKARQIISFYFPNVSLGKQSQFADEYTRTAYSTIKVTESLLFWDSLSLAQQVTSELPISMEMLDINNDAGQSYGYTLYRSELLGKSSGTSTSIGGFKNVHDRGIMFVDQKKSYVITDETSSPFKVVHTSDQNKIILDILVENGGRINWESFDDQRKGLTGPITADGVVVKGWTIYAYEMKPEFIASMLPSDFWKSDDDCLQKDGQFPKFFKFELLINSAPQDTYLDMKEWGKGVVFINGRNLGRYWNIGPQKALYLPAPWLKKGKNKIVLFEEIKCANALKFSADPNLG